jgi:hypothetical protein
MPTLKDNRVKQRVEIEIPGVSTPIPIKRDTHDSLVQMVKEYQRIHNANDLWRDKIRVIDRAYACYVASKDKNKADEQVAQIIDDSGVHFTTPVVVSQVDSIVAYLSELYLSGYPIFPVVTPPEDTQFGEQLEAVVDDHSIRGRWPRQINLTFRDGAKYNVCGLELEWGPIGTLQVNKNNQQVGSPSQPTLDVEQINRLFNMDMYNLFWDQMVDIPDVTEYGEYVGYNDLWTRGRVKQYISNLTKAGETTMNVRQALESAQGAANDEVPRQNYYERPLISNFDIQEDVNMSTNWLAWALAQPDRKERIDYSNKYLFTKTYSRIIPADHGLDVPEPNVPQIWKFVSINNSHIIHMKKVISAFDMFPILLGQFTEDGFRTQTKSVAEQQLSIQDATSELVNIRLNSARRSISDRAIYNPSLIDPQDVNTRTPAPKIPIRQNLKNADLNQAYRSIEFNDTGTARAFDDIVPLLNLSEFLGGLNSARQGGFRRGNRTLGEFNEIMSNSDMRSRMIALMMEYQVFTPLKQQIKGNILLNMGSTRQDLISNRTDKQISVNVEDIRTKLMNFKVADGYLPTSLLANTDVVQAAFNLLIQSPLLQAKYAIAPLFSHMMALAGMRGLSKFELPPEQAAQQQAQIQASQGGTGNAPAGQ